MEGYETMPVSAQSKQPMQKNACAIRPKYRRFVLRPIIDAAAAWLVFGFVTAIVTCAPLSAGTNVASPAAFSGLGHAARPAAVRAVGEPGPAPIIEIATTSSPANADAVYRRTSAGAAWGLLGIAVSLLAAFNLSIFRHLRRAYATPKRREGNRK
jgi:hypothetical protein